MKAVITGVSGQDGFYLAQCLQEHGYEVVGLQRRVSQGHRLPDCDVRSCDITDASAVARVIGEVSPDEVYNLAAQSHVGESFKIPAYTFAVNAAGALNVLQAAKDVGAKFYQASTSELFGTEQSPQSETTSFHPRSPYGVAKLAAYWQTVNYREAYGMYTCNGVLFNHESPIRGKDFVTQKVCQHAAYVFNGGRTKLKLGNLDARRDWGHAKDYVEAMRLMMQQDKPGDYVVATGKCHSIRELCHYAYSYVGLNWQEWVEVAQSEMRPADVPELCGNPEKITALGWKREYDFPSLIREMVEEAQKHAV